MYKKSSIICSFALMLMVVSGCGDEVNDGNGTQDEGSVENVNLALTTGNTGSAIYALGGGFGQAIENHIPGSSVSVIGSAGYGENAVMLATGEADIGTTSYDNAAEALEEQPELIDDLRYLATAHQTVQHTIVADNSDIETHEDLVGNSVSVGEPGSGTENISQAILETYDISYDDINEQYLSFNEGVEALQDGQVDAVMMTTMMPNPNIMSLEAEMDIRFLPIEENDIDDLNEIFPSTVVPSEIPGEMYDNEEDIPTMGSPAGYVVREDMDDELAYELTRIMIEHSDEVEDAHPAAEQWTLENALLGDDMPYHAGAVRYFEEIEAWNDREEGVEGNES